MAIISCLRCSRNISEYAKICPHCSNESILLNLNTKTNISQPQSKINESIKDPNISTASEILNSNNPKNEKSWYQKWWGVAIIILIILGVIGNLVGNKNSDSSSTISACQCSERWLATPKEFMKATDRWKYDECVRKFGGFAGANSACVN
jgi:hypothetical protein